ncbi:transport ATP-binding protein, CydCD [Cutibacterium acnes KPA171202]|uniref:Transport ATP-binding protein, CydCD n=1 Tax=Cutibacterium acnes (strain DSM 16379 / KPA171202) TaxID=267747 RepID=Q6ABD5_CUTAK|nr:transport ATP-binding protein, CydCD [Cutibacterium acnes KPA171202]ADE00674.1 thiol reductant ABC exporter, CydD subunit [Cutibacterium acnes SK137]EGL41972.1 thiol reductant ABC exporter, CydD subunit [Propionibacterium sp. 434-HC2]EGR91945.1 thiol reductant ABC exporter, CydD subunit [Cutibacterium acnes SK182]EHC26918.1 ABC transporter, CydDC cysteine exporter family, permease/ATP-binding protein CydD [Propionibacterium sp. 5_U_42AFAA]ERS20658.1 thiol reductant ABC exporter, CydD subuni
MAAPLDPRLVRRARATLPFLAGLCVVGVATALLILAQAWLLSRGVSSVFAAHHLDGVAMWCGLLAAVFCGRACLAWLQESLAHRASASVKSQLRRDILQARLSRPTDATMPSGTLISLMTTGLDALDGYYSKYLPQLVLAVIVPAVLATAIGLNDLTSLVIVVVTIPLIPVFMALIGWRTEAAVAKRFKVATRLANHFADLVAGLPTLQVFGRARAQLEGLRRTEAANRSETMRTLRISFLSSFILELLATLSVALVAVTVGFRVAAGGMDLRTSLFILILAPEVFLPVRQVGVLFHDAADGMAAAEVSFGLIESGRPTAPKSDVEIASPREVPVVISGLTHTYEGTDRAAPDGLSLRIEPGSVVALVGHSGGGKTTALSCLLGFIDPDSGSILVGDRELIGADESVWQSWRRQLAYVPQVPAMMAGTVAENIRLGCSDAPEAMLRDALDRCGAAAIPLNKRIDDDAEGLSAGERRRVALARALVRVEQAEAGLLVLDEPTAGLDADTEATVLEAVRASGASVLVVSHRRNIIAAADVVVDLEVLA